MKERGWSCLPVQKKGKRYFLLIEDIGVREALVDGGSTLNLGSFSERFIFYSHDYFDLRKLVSPVDHLGQVRSEATWLNLQLKHCGGGV